VACHLPTLAEAMGFSGIVKYRYLVRQETNEETMTLPWFQVQSESLVIMYGHPCEMIANSLVEMMDLPPIQHLSGWYREDGESSSQEKAEGKVAEVGCVGKAPSPAIE